MKQEYVKKMSKVLSARTVARFFQIEASGGLVLLAFTAVTLALANSPLSAAFESFWEAPAGVTLGKFALEKSLEDAKVDYQSVDHSGAVHAFTNPDADRIAAAGGMKGMIGYNEPAARRSWKAMQVFFDEIFGAR